MYPSWGASGDGVRPRGCISRACIHPRGVSIWVAPPPPPVNRMAHACKNITFPTLRVRAVNNCSRNSIYFNYIFLFHRMFWKSWRSESSRGSRIGSSICYQHGPSQITWIYLKSTCPSPKISRTKVTQTNGMNRFK